MTLLLHNPIGNMYGPYFLALYAIVIIGVGVIGKYAISRNDPMASRPLVPSQPDAYLIAFLRGGENEVMRVGIYKLIKMGFLEVCPMEGRSPKSNAQVLQMRENAPDRSQLAPVEIDILHQFSAPATSQSAFRSSLPGKVAQGMATVKDKLISDGLLSSDEQQRNAARIRAAAVWTIVVLGAYKFLVAVATGHVNVGFLVGLGILGSIGVSIILRQPRITRRGAAYLERLRRAFRSSRRLSTSQTETIDAAILDLMVVTVALDGMAALDGTPDARIGRMFAASSSNSTASCGGAIGSFGSGSCSSGGGGASCGGGGGGCGGCGGGT